MLGLLVEWYTEPAIRQGEVDRAVGLDHDIVRPIELASPEAACNHSNAAVEFLPGDALGPRPRKRRAGPEYARICEFAVDTI